MSERLPAPKPTYTREQALRFPLAIDSHDMGFRYLFDFTVAARALELRPGARVLDFASGSGFVSELLNRFGYETVACDFDLQMLRNARERLGTDPRCIGSLAHFVTGDGQSMPLADESFDGVICMNALHHMDDYDTALREIHRVLRPGARAAFSEPGSEHSRSPDSVNMARQFGVVEKDIVLAELHEMAREIGFERMLVKPMVYPEFVDVDYEDFPRFRQGQTLDSPLLAPAGIATVLEKSHSIFTLVKAGIRTPTSANAAPELLRASLEVSGFPSRTEAGKPVRFTVRCSNTGESVWVHEPRPVGGQITLGVKIVGADGRLLDDLQGRMGLPADVSPGESVEIQTQISLEELPPGRYGLVVDMVNERVAWFADLGSEPVELWLDL
jgi:ubiquinone/menaquinone biosynthesis C-methylase UbiE